MKKLKVAFLWHQHQPYYKLGEEFILPWVLLHGTKDYFDIPEVLYEFPNIKQTFNFAPSLSLQIDEYITGNTKDNVQRLTAIDSESLNIDEKKEIIEYFFHANYENMISPYPRYKELFDWSRNKDYAVHNFSAQDWLDLQVWYNLTWFGYFSSKSGLVRQLFEKGRGFTEIEKKSLQNEQNDILKKINYQYRKLYELGQIELSCSPMYHPILPLLINSDAAHESRPNQPLPTPIFNFPEDASLQMKLGLEYFKQTFDYYPNGVWPSEGSVSDDVLELMIENNVKWIATDEKVLENSIKDGHYLPTEKFFPRKYVMKNGEITVYFRDHFLSDRIGFEYSKWNEFDAANDFMHHLRSIRSEIIKNHGEVALDSACVSVILDGENCWEYYKDNGIPFLRSLFGLLTHSDVIETVKFSDIIEGGNFLNPLSHIFAGSWINSNFDIWIGHKDDIKAWDLLSKARHELRRNSDRLNPVQYERALHSLLIAEGSDWFWWYGPEHQTVNKPDFDKLFRHYIGEAYRAMNLQVPEDVLMPVELIEERDAEMTPKLQINKVCINDLNLELDKAGYIPFNTELSAMHRIGDFLDSINYGNDNNYIYIKLNSNNILPENYQIKLIFPPQNKEIFISENNFSSEIRKCGIVRNSDFIIIIIPISEFSHNTNLLIETNTSNVHNQYPKNQTFNLTIIKESK
ncbi:MAG: hypothetical protein KIT33_09245 [Candidatus Kapabacteria bacterium]|nr:hypothetical protein [Ignavibacteriota bacterium]MCW5885141.1 hypothetical protein [Candidatus Kapabacteria bacterium]